MISGISRIKRRRRISPLAVASDSSATDDGTITTVEMEKMIVDDLVNISINNQTLLNLICF